MYYANIKKFDIATGVGVRTSLFVSGCRNACEGCFNSEAWDFYFGEEYTETVEYEIIKSLVPDYIEGLTILGGEPFEPENQPDVLRLVRRAKEIMPNKTIWIYSGFTYEELLDGSRASLPSAREILSLADVLVDGRFIQSLKNISLKFRGSENQRLIDLKKTIASGEIVHWEG